MSILCPSPLVLGSVPALIAITAINPPMIYDSTLGTPDAQKIIPPFQNLPAHIDDITGAHGSFTWNYLLGVWL